ncbi:conjugative transposon protein TraM [Tunicatimonas pelagia]|uniref:conjugative transposon protein TraM n=1 Tax=Tunicatimonas pelagia TaxID=931531 RepID=UPI00266676EB|nr:conjugative transposon protein TraM [Tunicatimonas pelagia]WKN44254.1 conjugative transposon protein TraM [Tunicatimonas pelagia]
MKNFQENLDEASINQEKADRFADSSTTSRTFRQKLVQVLSRYSLLIIVGLAALSITVLHFQGQYLLQVLRGTPLPNFELDEEVDDSPLPDKTKVYKEALAEEAKVTRPSWQVGYQKPAVIPDTTMQDTAAVDAAAMDMVEVPEPTIVRRKIRKKRQITKTSKVVTPPVVEKTISFFQPVRAISSQADNQFFACVIHGDQEVGNRTRIVLRLSEDATLKGQTVSAGTLVYGMARLGQDRLQITVSRLGSQAIQYQVYDHTYHEGILLNESEDRMQQATKETAVRQAQRNTYRLPTQIASEVARDLLMQSRRRKQSVFLPDGYPLYISSIQK